MSGIVVTISLKKDIHIPKNSFAIINSGLLSSSSILISKGDASDYLGDGDTITTQNKLSLVSQVEKNIDPIVAKIKRHIAITRLTGGSCWLSLRSQSEK